MPHYPVFGNKVLKRSIHNKRNVPVRVSRVKCHADSPWFQKCMKSNHLQAQDAWNEISEKSRLELAHDRTISLCTT